jgi:hypothetical protein
MATNAIPTQGGVSPLWLGFGGTVLGLGLGTVGGTEMVASSRELNSLAQSHLAETRENDAAANRLMTAALHHGSSPMAPMVAVQAELPAGLEINQEYREACGPAHVRMGVGITFGILGAAVLIGGWALTAAANGPAPRTKN